MAYAEGREPGNTARAVEAEATPVAESERIDSLDVLRGVAVLGIFIMNIQSFAMYDTVYFNPSYHGMLEGTGYIVWYVSHLFAAQKFMTIFSLVFGAGIVLFASRKEEKGLASARYHYRRTGWLILFGLVHAYLIWGGDVLFLYGVCALWVYLFRRIRPSRLIILGLVVLAVGSGLSLVSGLTHRFWPEEAAADFVASIWRPPVEELEKMDAAYTGGFLDRVRYCAPHVFGWQTFVLVFWGVWRAGGLMLLGMAMYKTGVFAAARSRKFYATLVAAGVVGLWVVAYGVRQDNAYGWDAFKSFFLFQQYNYWASIMVSGGYIGAVMLACRSRAVRPYTRPFAAAGRMAFSNYIGQSLAGSFVFYGVGLGYYNQIDRVGQVAIVVAVWVFQLVVSTIWLRRFRFGPLEWLWRSLTYGRRQPMRI